VLAGIRPTAILDFGSGVGRVTRWLRAHWPTTRIAATDLREEDLAFCAAGFGRTTFLPGTDIAALRAPGRYDLIWAGSVLTHLAQARAEALIGKLLSWTRPDGVIVASLHGRYVTGRGVATRRYGLDESGGAGLLEGYRGEAAVGYADYPPTPGYGVSLSRLAWAAALAERLPGARLW
jgi:SAM-dependent methyltransferase